MELIVKLVKKLSQEVGQGKNGQWIKGAFIAETEEEFPKEGEFPKKVCFTVWGEKMIKALDSIKEDDQIKVHFSVESREYNERWYTDLRAYRIDSLMTVTPNQEQAQQEQPMTEKFPPQVEVPSHPDRVPFDTPATEEDSLPF